MDMHDRAWNGIKIVILASEPLLPMKIEQAIAQATPSVEVQLSSFESYDQAYQFCKSQQDVGFFFIHENCGHASFQKVFRELAATYKNHDLPAFGAILHGGDVNSFSEKTVGKDFQLLEYIGTDSLLNTHQTFDTLQNLWHLYANAFEESILPKGLQRSILSVAEEELGTDGVHFLVRLMTNLVSDLNVSWLESIGIKWSPFLRAVNQRVPAMLRGHQLLNALLTSSFPDVSTPIFDIQSFLSGEQPLPVKASNLALWLNKQRKNGTLSAELAKFMAAAKPGAPKLLRHVGKNANRISEFADDATQVLKSG